jgi:hypothetical protein
VAQFEATLKGHSVSRAVSVFSLRLYSLPKTRLLVLLLGGAALQRCGNCIVLRAALAAEVTLSACEPVFPQPVQPCPNAYFHCGFSRWGTANLKRHHYHRMPMKQITACVSEITDFSLMTR